MVIPTMKGLDGRSAQTTAARLFWLEALFGTGFEAAHTHTHGSIWMPRGQSKIKFERRMGWLEVWHRVLVRLSRGRMLTQSAGRKPQ